MNKKSINCLIDFLSEEIPAGMQPYIGQQISKIFNEKLVGFSLNFNQINTFTSPRHFGIIIQNLQKKQSNQKIEIRGPKTSSSKIAVNGFIKTQNVSKNDLVVKQTKKGNFYFLEKKIKGKSIYELIPEIIQYIIDNLNWPKSQRWGNTDAKWGRPLRNILAITNEKKINGIVSLGSDETLKLTNYTFGHRCFSKKIIIKNPYEYENLLKDNGVLISRKKREKELIKQINFACKKRNLIFFQDKNLLSEVLGLIEIPNVLIGNIEKKFMKLPFEILSTAMKVHQKYFTLLKNNNKKAENFLMVANIPSDLKINKEIIQGNERVLRARLSDALFFWKTDLSENFEKWLNDLKNVKYYENLGTLHDKSLRLSKVNTKLSIFFSYKDTEKASKLGLFSKVDLMTNMVTEFPELQGIVGGYYSKTFGFDNEFKYAYMDQYLPVGNKGMIPRNALGCIMSLSNNIDILSGFFSIGLFPSGSRDPFALRRSAYSLIRVLIEKKVNVSLRKLFNSVEFQKKADNRLNDELSNFILERFKMYLLDNSYNHDVINSVIKTNNFKEIPLFNLLNLMREVKKFSKKKSGRFFIVNYKRVFNILKNISEKDYTKYVDPKLLKNNFEKDLHRYLEDFDETKTKNVALDFKEVFNNISKSSIKIDKFFKNTLVNVKSKELRSNRLTLLKLLLEKLSFICDFEKIND